MLFKPCDYVPMEMMYDNKYMYLHAFLDEFVMYLASLLLCGLLLLNWIGQPRAQDLVEAAEAQEEPRDCLRTEVLIKVHSQEYGSVLWIDGERYGFIPIKVFCLSSGLHDFALHTVSGSNTLNTKQFAHQRAVRSQVLWIPNTTHLSIDLSRLNLSNIVSQTELNSSRLISSDAQLNTPSASAQVTPDNTERLLDHLLLSSEFIAVGSRPVMMNSYDQELKSLGHLLNRQSVSYHNAPAERLQIRAELRGLKDLVDTDHKVHLQDPWNKKFKLWVQELNIGFHWQLGSPISHQNNRVKDADGQIRLGRMLVQHGARTNLLDGLTFSQSLFRHGDVQWLNDLKLHLSVANNRSQKLSFNQAHSIISQAQNQNLWTELGLSYTQQSRLRSEVSKLKLNLSLLQMNTTSLGGRSQITSSWSEDYDRLGLLELEWLDDDQYILSHMAINSSSQLSHSHQKIALSHQRLNLRFRALWTYYSGDIWDQQWFTPVLWPNTYQDSQLSLRQALVWNGVQFAYGYQQGAKPTWYGAQGNQQATGQALSVTWGALGSAFIRLARSNFLEHRLMTSSDLNQVGLSDSHLGTQIGQGSSYSQVSPQSLDSASPSSILSISRFGVHWNFGFEWLLIQNYQAQDWSQAPQNQSDSLLGSANISSDSVDEVNRDTKTYVISSAWRMLKNYTRQQIKWEARLSYAYLERELWPELSLAWRYEQLELSAQCAKPLSSPLLLSLNRWFSYCGLQLELDTWVKR